jgi:Na+/proline symporter
VLTTTILWLAMAVYGLVMIVISPKVKDFGSFFAGRDDSGEAVGLGMLVGSIVISWLFAKSITNAANLGGSYGLVGSVAYAGWYLSIPVAGVVIYALRTRLGATSIGEFITGKYGRAATGAFTLVIMLRLFNEVWSNSAVVGAYFGEAKSTGYFVGALAFTAVTLVYSLRGGLRSSILTDGIQFLLALFLLVFVLALVIPESGAGPILTSGEWTLAGGVDLLLVGLLQSFSYPFHDPVLTDRGFITDAKSMLKGYLVAGFLAAGFIVVFGFVGIHGHLAGIDISQDAPLAVAKSFGVATLTVMSLIMMVSAGSTLDSTLSSFSKAFVVDLGGKTEEGTTTPVLRPLTEWLANADTVKVGRITMVVTVILGTLPLFAGAAILKATTISGTMVLGLAPIFLLFAWRTAGPFAFHLALWPGVAIGIAYAAGAIPESWAMGGGPYAALLGANVVGTAIVFGGFVAGAVIDGVVFSGRKKATTALVVLAVMLCGTSAFGQSAPPDEPTEDVGEEATVAESEAPALQGISFSGHTMLRLTTKFADLSRPSVEI